MLSAFAYSAKAAGLPLLHWGHPQSLQAAFWRNAYQAGKRFAAIAEQKDLTFLENWALDHATHRAPEQLSERLVELDSFTQGFLENSTTTLLITSDHGNAEELWHTQHTRNPVPLVVAGPMASHLPPMHSLQEVAPWIMQILGVELGPKLG
jgi:2,3-bisphosphoglycerate-independent phosphoglycerate mutase